MAGSLEHDNKPSAYKKGAKFIDRLSDYRLYPMTISMAVRDMGNCGWQEHSVTLTQPCVQTSKLTG
jgi:hypothetical protein